MSISVALPQSAVESCSRTKPQQQQQQQHGVPHTQFSRQGVFMQAGAEFMKALGPFEALVAAAD